MSAKAKDWGTHMNTKPEQTPNTPVISPGGLSMFANARLKKLRHERQLIERAILALTDIVQTRRARARRGIRN
jgi:hypothetical protein